MGEAGCKGCRPPLCGAGGGWPPWVPFPIHIPARQVQGSSACAGLLKTPNPGRNLSRCWGPSLQGVEKLNSQPQLPGVLQESEMPGVGPPGASGKQFRVSRCYLWVKGQGAVHRTPLSLTSLPGWTPPPGDTCICVCSLEAHMRPPLLSRGQATTCLWLAPGPSCTPHCLVCHSSARERSQCA